MDDRRFDSMVKSLASGANRRTVLKGLLGLGGASIVGSAVLEQAAEAARRPTPTPKPPSCPGLQSPCASGCCCPAGLHNCGPDCCTEGEIPAPNPGHSECCDNACCFGTCYGEELCCPTNNRSTGEFPIPPTHQICDGVGGPICCGDDQYCCADGDGVYCSDLPCILPACVECELGGGECCFINDVFAGCAPLVEGWCCTAEACDYFNDFANCLVGACDGFQCEQWSSCLDTEFCCDGECSPIPCIGPLCLNEGTECSESTLPCCEGYFCNTVLSTPVCMEPLGPICLSEGSDCDLANDLCCEPAFCSENLDGGPTCQVIV